MSEIDDLIAQKGVMIAGRFGPDWSLVEHKTAPLVIETPAAIAMLATFCSTIEAMFNALMTSLDAISPGQWTPVHGWGASSGDYSVALAGSRFVIADTKQVGSYDDVRRLLQG